jgi:hypothetical protein
VLLPETLAAVRNAHGDRVQLAVGHSILVSAYWMLTRDEPHSVLCPEWLAAVPTRPPRAGWSPS